MPFHTRLLGKDRLALYSFIQSLNTSFGVSIFEPIAAEVAKKNFSSVTLHQSAGDFISSEAQRVIQTILDNLTIASVDAHKINEINAIRSVCNVGDMKAVKVTKVDLKVVRNDGAIFLFDLKTVKPNAGGFKEFKRTLLECLKNLSALCWNG